METLVTSRRIFRDQDTRLECIVRVQFAVEEIYSIEEWNDDDFFANKQPKCHVTMRNGQSYVLLESFDNITRMRRSVELAQIFGRTMTTNRQ
jgi:hypothetical protein